MRSDTPCPDDRTLRGLLFGFPAEADVEEHFRECADCATRAADLDGSGDTLAEAVRTARGVPAASGAPPGYEVLGDIDRGGMGAVYKARDGRLGRVVALKVMLVSRHAQAEYRARFRAEAGAVAALNHPGVVSLYEFGEWDGLPFFALEYCPGGTLAKRLAGTPLSAREAAGLLSQLADAVAAAHTGGIVHRDLKPQNVLFDAAGRPKVADFGLAKVVGDGAGLTLSGAVVGTPAYMAPEQARGESATVGPSADVWALGAVLYECLTGRPPFRGATDQATLAQVLTADPVSARALNPSIPIDLETVCVKCLEKDPGRRYPTAKELADDLGRFLRGEPVMARPVGPGRRALKWAGRRPTTAALAVGCLVSLAALTAVIAIYTIRLREAAATAEANAEEARRQKSLAAGNYRSAREALRRMLARLEDRRAADVPRLRELRRDQLEDALTFYEGVLAGTDDPEPEVRLDAAVAATELGEIQYTLGRYAAARTSFSRAVAVLEKLPDAYRTRTECRAGLVRAYNHLANLDPGGFDEATVYFRKAHAEAEELARAAPDDPHWRNNLARAEHNLGSLFQVARRPAQAIPHYLRAVEIREALITQYPATPDYRADLGEDLLNLGLIYLATNHRAEAAAAFVRAEELLRPLAEANLAHERYGLSLAGVYVNWGNLLRFGNDLPGAIAKFDRAVDLADTALNREPDFATARQRATEAHGARAFALTAAGRPADALPDWDVAIRYAGGPEKVHYQVIRTAALQSAGARHDRIAVEAHDFARTPGLTDDDRYNLSCVFALCIEPARTDPALGGLAGAAAGELHATTALTILRQLEAAGYFRPTEHAKLLADDPDFTTLRHHPEFNRLLVDVANGPKP